MRVPERPTQPRRLLVGRSIEQALIDDLLRDAERGAAASVLFVGPPGIGKSALVDHAIGVASGFRVIRIVGVESEMTFGYAAVHQLAVHLLDFVDALPELQRATLEAVLATTGNDALDPFRVGLAVLSLAEHAARAQPLLVVIDDAQWVDDESAMALSFVGRRLHSERIASLLTMRDTPDAAGRFEGIRRIALGGLSAPEASELLTAGAAGPVYDAVADQIVAATEGNPLALVELAELLTDEQLGGLSPLPEPLPIGGRLSGLFASRVAALDAGARAVLLLAAAERFGDPDLLRRAADVIGGLSWDDAVSNAQASGLVAFVPKVAFRHPLVRSAVYYSADAIDRRRAHAALAEALDHDLDADRRAWHLGAAATGPDEQAARALEDAAERARQRGGASAAAFLLWRAAELTPDPERATGRLLEAARAELVGGRVERAQEMLDRARQAGLTARRGAEVAWTEALIHIVSGNVRQAAALMADALPLVAAEQPQVAAGASAAAVAAALVGGHLIQQPTRQAIAAGTRRVAMRSGLAQPISSVMVGLATVVSEARAAADETLRTAVSDGADNQARLQAAAGRSVHVVYFDTIIAAARLLDDRAWAALVEEWSLLARRIGALSSLPLALSLRSWLEVLQGRFGSAASHLAEIEDVVSLTGSRGLLGAPSPAMVLRDAWRGDDEATRHGARRMMQDAHERGQGIGIDHAYAALAVLELGAGRYDAALRAGRHLLDHDSAVLGTLALADVVEAATRCGEPAVAGEALERLSVRAAESATPWAGGMRARAQALVATGDEADALFRSALDQLSSTSIATEIARTQLLHGEWLRRARRRKHAREPLHDALDFFEGIGASGFAARSRAELAATGEHVRTRSTPVDVLTPQELQVARLAASGQRNYDIAAHLYISTSTVEYHLRKIFVKLGVTSRTQLAQVDLPT